MGSFSKVSKFLLLSFLLLPFAMNSTQTKSSAPIAIVQSLPNIKCAPQLQKYLRAILKIPEAQPLFEAIQKDGSVRIVARKTSLSNKFRAFWDPDQRVINIDLSVIDTDGLIIGYLLLELHNASINSHINHLNKLANTGKIGKRKYVESMEYLEYVNSISASNIAKIGIQKGLFPADSCLPTFTNFKEHFQAQKQSGHSACYAYNYDRCLKPAKK